MVNNAVSVTQDRDRGRWCARILQVALGVQLRDAFESVSQSIREWTIRVCEGRHKLATEVRDEPRDPMPAPRGQSHRTEPVQHDCVGVAARPILGLAGQVHQEGSVGCRAIAIVGVCRESSSYSPETAHGGHQADASTCHYLKDRVPERKVRKGARR